jgi:membrane protein DedA with SNARE-associated domain
MMGELNLTELFLNGMISYGSIVLGIALLIGAAGVPVPGTLFIVAAGALVQQDILNLPLAFGLAVLGATTGDSVSYALGRWANGWMQGRFGESTAWQKAQTNFNRRGNLAVYLTCWLITPLAVPTNAIAGLNGYSWKRFLVYDGAGEITWVLVYGGLGYAFGSQWELVSQYLTDFSGWLVAILAIGAGICFLLRRQRQGRRFAFNTVRNLVTSG